MGSAPLKHVQLDQIPSGPAQKKNHHNPSILHNLSEWIPPPSLTHPRIHGVEDRTGTTFCLIIAGWDLSITSGEGELRSLVASA